MKQNSIKYIGVDVGGTKILVQAFDEKLKLLGETIAKTDVHHGKAGFLKQLTRLIDGHFTKTVRGIGVAVPGIVDYRKGILVKAPHLPTGKNLALKTLLEKRYKTPVHVDHDINAFLAAEASKPHLKKRKNLLAVMVGTGLGGAALVDGKLFYGKSGFAGEFGHMVIDEEGALKTLEQKTSGHFLPQIAKSLKLPHPARWHGDFFAKRLDAKDNNALLLKKSLTESLGIGLSNLNLIFNPEAILLGGSVYLKFLADRAPTLKRAIAKHSLSGTSPKLVDSHGPNSIPKGAILLLQQKRP
ncbi:ROK family protein [Candidatus Peregrinibacteria bacterium]|nr:ROK family protein [Candidatus Peregrinibacteria bacterium]